MKKFLMIVMALLTIGSNVTVEAQKKEKKAKKEKKELKWEWDGKLSSDKDINEYLRSIDTLYHRVQAYKEDFGSFTLDESFFFFDNKLYSISCMVDDKGRVASRARVNWQFAQAYLEGSMIVLDMANAGLSSANAALKLPKLGLEAFSFAKYVKGGPAVIAKGTSAIKEIRATCLKNSRKWKEMKDGSLTDAATIGYMGFTEEAIKKLNKYYYIKEIRMDDPVYTETIVKYRDMTSDEISEQCRDVAQRIDNATVLPEDKNKESDEEIDFEKAMKELENEAK